MNDRVKSLKKHVRQLSSRDVIAMVITGATLGLSTPSVFASDFYKITVIAQSGTQFGSPDWTISATNIGLNNAGVVTWDARRTPVGGVTEGGIFYGDGTAAPTLTSITGGAVPSINNQGQISFVANVPAPGGGTQSRIQLWNNGVVSDICTFPQFVNCYSNSLADSGTGGLPRIPYRRNEGGWFFGNMAPLNQPILSASLLERLTQSRPPAISRNGQNVADSGGEVDSTYRIVMAGPAVGGRADLVFPHLTGQSGYRVTGLSINDHGNTAFVSQHGLNDSNRAFVGVITRPSGTPSVVKIADDSTGEFDNFFDSPSLNNLNEVAFGGRRPAVDFGATLYVSDLSGSTPKPVIGTEAVLSDGSTIRGYANLFPHSMNDKGSIAFLTTLTPPGGGQRLAIVRADPLPGVSPGNPIMPLDSAPLPSGWRFALNCQPAILCRAWDWVASRSLRFIDPPVAVGYTYTVEAPGPNFAVVNIPAPLPNGDDTFQVEFAGQVASLKAGEVFDFTSVVPGGVSTFRITGIDTSAGIDPTNAAAFVTGLGFASDATADYTVTMVPIIEDPDDLDLDGVPNASDLCPNTAPGAPVDSAGCSADQRDSDGDGVVDSLDQCPATALGQPVNADGCSAQQLDADGDGVSDALDACPGTAPGAAVDANGCSADQRDTDGDGVVDSRDLCPNTPVGSTANADGCAPSQLDSDGDGVPDSNDLCPGTAPGTAVGTNGCPLYSGGGVCDANGDNFIDYRDIELILRALGSAASGPTDPRDANRNGKIDLRDAAICTAKCDRFLCLPPK